MKRWNRVLIPVFFLLMIFASLFSVRSIVNMQGYGKLINYLGIVRGCGQRIVKLESSRQPKDFLIDYVDDILTELSTGKGKYGLTPLKDDTYKKSLQKLSKEWDEIKKEIDMVRDGADSKRLLALSENFFATANDTVFIADNYSKRLKLEDVADHVGLTSGYLQKLFRKERKTSVIEYLLRYRIEQGCRYLVETNNTIVEISEVIGFSDIKNFHYAFKKVLGMTPNEYRRIHKNKTILSAEEK